jgi:GH25 family lysozyme M1 (1,4-beta-N-acetylmuramidase)
MSNDPIRGIDVSNWQNGIEWAAVAGDAKHPVFAMCKLSEGLDYVDPYGARNYQGMLAQPQFVLRGLYHFAAAEGSASGQAARFVSLLPELVAGDALVLDLEVQHPSPVQFALDWLWSVEEATGVHPIVYTYKSYADEHLVDERLAQYGLWLAKYNDSPDDLTGMPVAAGAWEGAQICIWQHSSEAHYDGVSGPCDSNVSYLSLEALAALGKAAG